MEYRIRHRDHLAQWTQSPAYQQLVDFIERYNQALMGKEPACAQAFQSQPALELEKMMQSLIASVDRFPPTQDLASPLRFGNPLFRDWYAETENTLATLLAPFLASVWQAYPARAEAGMKQCLSSELTGYFLGSLGSPVRLDYGTGHELSFLAFLCLCEQAHCWTEAEMPLVISSTYRLEPAGSHGAWGLDDYAFLSFIWGSAQLADKEDTYPTDAINSPDQARRVPRCYLYFDAVHYIYQMKRGPLSSHSPILYDISGIPGWRKINGGLIKMYKAEVLGKFPVVQHFLFGRLLAWEAA